ncbi:MAG: ATP synthase F1 subunit gamma [Elusimicrobiales bacterium]|nr:ATP synthase F1 subunit gamma [Elusimicrobiales bacterium]
MESLRDIRRNIKSVTATRQIMRTMKMVASARVKRAQSAILSGRPFAAKMEELLSTGLADELRCDEIGLNPVFRGLCGGAAPDAPAALVVITADKGLCGPFNSTVIRAALDWLRRNKGRKVKTFFVGRKGRDYLRRVKTGDIEQSYELTGIFPRASYAHAELLGRQLLPLVRSGAVGEVVVVYNEFKSLLSQRIVVKRLLPVEPAPPPAKEDVFRDDFIFEPDKRGLIEALLVRYVKAQLYRILLESQSAELAARMNAMESAGKNAEDLLDGLKLKLNRTRQSMITTEISEIVGGSEALNG